MGRNFKSSLTWGTCWICQVSVRLSNLVLPYLKNIFKCNHIEHYKRVINISVSILACIKIKNKFIRTSKFQFQKAIKLWLTINSYWNIFLRGHIPWSRYDYYQVLLKIKIFTDTFIFMEFVHKNHEGAH